MGHFYPNVCYTSVSRGCRCATPRPLAAALPFAPSFSGALVVGWCWGQGGAHVPCLGMGGLEPPAEGCGVVGGGEALNHGPEEMFSIGPGAWRLGGRCRRGRRACGRGVLGMCGGGHGVLHNAIHRKIPSCTHHLIHCLRLGCSRRERCRQRFHDKQDDIQCP